MANTSECTTEEELKKKDLYLHLLDIGCCRYCSLRYLCDKSIRFDDRDPYFTNEKAEDDYDELISCKRYKIDENQDTEACIVCLGLLQKTSFQSVLNIITSNSKVKEYDCEEFTCSISVPACILLREQAMRWYLRDKFGDSFKEDSVEIPLNRAWKLFVKDKMAEIIKLKYQNSEICDFSINVSMGFCNNETELEVLKKMRPDVFAERQKRSRQYSELYTRNCVARVLDNTPAEVFKTHYTLPPSRPEGKQQLDCASVEYKHNPVYIAGRYCKYSRELSQTPWFIDGKKCMETSIQEIIFEAVKKELEGVGEAERKLIFTASGREDVDVLCLGDGRPFYVEITNPIKTKFKYEQFRRIEEDIKLSGLIEVRDLQLVQKLELQNIKKGEEEKTKEYHALCVTKELVTEEHMEKLRNHGPVELFQKTPIRVLHRRPFAVRKKMILKMAANAVPGKPHIFELFVTTQAGTYVKEFVHGDFQRTSPNLTDILKMEVDIAALDVTAINLDWPKRITTDIC